MIQNDANCAKTAFFPYLFAHTREKLYLCPDFCKTHLANYSKISLNMQTAERTNTATRAPHIDHVVMDNVEVYPLHEAMTHCITLEESKRRLTEMIHDHFHSEVCK